MGPAFLQNGMRVVVFLGQKCIGFRRFGVELDVCVLSGGMVKIVFFTIATIIAITVTHHHHHHP